MKDNGHEERDDLDELRRLLLGDEIEQIDRLRERLDVPENFSSEISDVLPRAMVKSSEHGEDLSQAMVQTVEDIVRLSIKKDINKFADALFPVIGPAIRKSIRETIRQMLQSLNRALEQSLSWQGMKWRLESMRTGIPFAQIALLHGLVYRVEQVFLIHRHTGLMLHHLGQDDVSKQNPDLVSSMLSAINDFVGDSFELEAERSLNSVEVGELSLWIEAGPDAILAVAIRGEAPNSLRETLQRTLERVQGEFGDALEAFESDTAPFDDSAYLLDDCLQAQYQARSKGLSAKTIIFLLLLLAGLVYWIALEWQQARAREAYVDGFRGEPGYVITGVRRESGTLRLAGLRDPLARAPDEIHAESGYTIDPVDFTFSPYQALEPEFVERRARRILAPPDGVRLDFSDNRLTISGVTELEWRELLQARLPLITGLETWDDSGLRVAFTPELLDPPGGIKLEFENGLLYAEGAADQDFIARLQAVRDEYPEVESLDLRALVNLTEVELIKEIAALEKEVVLFDVATAFDFDSIDAPGLGRLARNIIALGDKLSRNVLIVVRGYSDSVGSFEDNQFLSRERADFVAQALFNTGINPRYISIRGLETPVAVEYTAAERRYNRRVEFEVIVE